MNLQRFCASVGQHVFMAACSHLIQLLGVLSWPSPGEPLMELVLKQGDLLYLPRGTVHKGEAVEGEESHHLTISTYQKLLA